MSDQEAVLRTPEPREFTRTNSIKAATPELLTIKPSDVPVDYMTDVLFEDIGGQEILSVSRNDLINGQKVIYSPIKNVSRINQRFNSNNLFPIPETTQSYFNNFAIKLEEKTPELGTGPNQETVYIDPVTGNVVVNVTNMGTSDLVEIQVLSRGDLVSDILYEDTES